MAKSKSKCRCKSSAGNQKRRYTSHRKALNAALARGWIRNAHIYRCPAVRTVWHLARRGNP